MLQKKPNAGLYDPMIIPRVKQYLEENVHQTYVDVGVMARQLQERYREYNRRKTVPFRLLVEQAYKTVLHSYGLDSNPSSENEDDANSDLEVMDDAGTAAGGGANSNHMNDTLTNMYLNNKNKPAAAAASGGGGDGEAIDISSDEDDDGGDSRDKEKAVSTTSTGERMKMIETQIASNKHITVTKITRPDKARSGDEAVDSSNGSTNGSAARRAAEQLAPIQSKRRRVDPPPHGLQSYPHLPQNSEVSNSSNPLLPYPTPAPHPAPRSTAPNLARSRRFKKEVFARYVDTTFEDLGGMDKILRDLCDLLLHVKHPEVYRHVGLPPPRGFLLHGPPGSGKTLLAHAIAGQLKIGLIEIPATELVAGVSGESEERIREVFEQAAILSPCVLFIDEIDAISANRINAQKDMERRIVAQLLSSLDGLTKLEGGDGVLVIGATNRPDALDPALRRIGRFDQEISLGIPDREARGQILKIICKNLKIADAIDFDELAKLTPGYVGADLLALATRAATIAIKRLLTEREKQQLLAEARRQVELEVARRRKEYERKIAAAAAAAAQRTATAAAAQKVDDDDDVAIMDVDEAPKPTGGAATADKPKENNAADASADDVVALEDDVEEVVNLDDDKDEIKEADAAKPQEADAVQPKEAEAVKPMETDAEVPKAETAKTEETVDGSEKKEGETEEVKLADEEQKPEETKEAVAEPEKKPEQSKLEESDVEMVVDSSTSGDKVDGEPTEVATSEVEKPIDSNEATKTCEDVSETAEPVEIIEQEPEPSFEIGPIPVPELTLNRMLNLLLDHSNPLGDEEMDGICINREDFLESLKSVQPSAKREGFITVPDVTWNDIGSLGDIREELKLAILAPVKFPQRLKLLGLNAPSGVLLCGPPGCGKTLLAKAVANEAGINFISVKGPELLNMYVGESERAVRQCFQRARNSAPCVIFFDEFDSLCPKRSDSAEGGSGMRVVNQLLTEMDGIEDRKGVFLMAATNRPDIVDPAVLRPGRLDKILYVGLPAEVDRVDILRALTKNGTQPPLAQDVDLSTIARLTEGYTGADLAGLVRQASLQTLKDSIATSSGDDKTTDVDSGEPQLLVGLVHFQEAIRNIKPSVNEEDKKHYERLRRKYGTPTEQ
ncbi:nuclear valosin-containing protein-like [Uranotaenia lowii]|uniref:nuclear valosin-containing protein-like n=1 Tax=Uranotaenia lowii TaxID=190385 RepID=UPI0024792BFF|nr:nuclear valosin-containing protein-like [Uranotaenia lowii]